MKRTVYATPASPSKPPLTLTARIRHNHKRIAEKSLSVFPPSSVDPIKVELYGDKVVYISPSTIGEPVVFVQPAPLRMWQANAADLTKLNGKIAPSLEERLRGAVSEVLEVLAKVESREHRLAAAEATAEQDFANL
jgi:hypothetical protein